MDLGEKREFTTLSIQWESAASGYHYELFGSNDGEKWSKLPDGQYKTAGKASVITFESLSMRYLKGLRFRQLRRALGQHQASLRCSTAKAARRIRTLISWMRIASGSLMSRMSRARLKAVAYKNGEQIGESSVKNRRPGGPAGAEG